MSSENKNTEKKLLTISLLVSNRKDTIRKCMESIKPLLDAVPSELIAVDTGCTDGSVDIVREYTDKVVPFVWCKDFSAARNAGLMQATGEWFLYLDDDEWFEDVTEIIEFFNSGEYKQYDTAWYIQRNYLDMTGENYKDCQTSRVCKRTPGLHFINKVHECFSTAGRKIKLFTSYVHHYGYVYKSEEEAKKHSERNVSLLLQELEENPNNLRLTCQLIQEYRAVKKFKEAKELCEKVLAETKEPYGNVFVQYIITCLPAIERTQKNEAGTEEMLKKVRETYPMTKLSWLVCAVENIMASENVENYEAILKKLPEYFVAYDQVQEMGQEVKYQEVMDRAFYTSQDMYVHMLENGVKLCSECKQYELVKILYERISQLPNSAISETRLQTYASCLFKMYLESNLGDVFFKHYGKLLERSGENDKICANIEKLWISIPGKRGELADGFESLHRKEPIFLLLHLLYWLQRGNRQEISQTIREYFSVSKGKFDAHIVALCLATPVYEEEVLRYVDFTTFQQGVALYLKEKLYGNVWNLKQTEPVWDKKYVLYWHYANMAWEEDKLLHQENVSAQMLLEYVDAVLAYASFYFSKEMLTEENRRWLPQNCQFALYVKVAWNAKKQGNSKAWTENMKKAAKVYPPMIAALQSVLKEEAERMAAVKVSPEMRQLAAELKRNVRELIEAGEYLEAKKFIQALKEYVPDDEEIKELEKLLFSW